MNLGTLTTISAVVTLTFVAIEPAGAQVQSQPTTIPLVVDAGRPLRVALDRKVKVKRVGQEVTATLVEPIYAYDRIVIPAGTKATGRIARLDPAPKMARIRGVLRGDFTTPRCVLLQFDSLQLGDGRSLAAETAMTAGAEVVLRVAKPQKGRSAAARA